MIGKRWVDVAKGAWTLWDDHRAGRTAAALAFYTLFSLAPILVIATAVAGSIWGREAVQGQLVTQLSHVLGAEGGALLQQMIANAYRAEGGGWAAVVALFAVVLGASAVFAELRDAFEQLWRGGEAKPSMPLSRVVTALVTARLRGVAVIIGIGFVLLASLVINSVLVSLSSTWVPMLIGEAGAHWWTLAVPWAMSLLVTMAMIAMLLRVMLPRRVPKAQLLGVALFGAVAFELAKSLVSFYLGHSAVMSTFGATGSVAILLLWLYVVGAVIMLCAVVLRAMNMATRPTVVPTASGTAAPIRDGEATRQHPAAA